MTETTLPKPGPDGSAAKPTKPISPGRIILAACIGNALEWYDIVIYSYFAVYISKAFFATDDPTLSLLLALGTFAVSFLIRPIGAMVLGSYADRVGRKPALTWSIMLMALGTLLIVIMPTSESIGSWAAFGILIARLIQGFAAGGEFGSATALMVEHMPERRGFAASFQFTSQAASSLIASIMGTALTGLMSAEDLQSWGFRIPFALGLLVAPVGIYIRNRVPEPEEATAARSKQEAHAPGRTLLRTGIPTILLTAGTIAVSTCVTYFITYIPTFATGTLGMSDTLGFAATIGAGLVLLFATSFAGAKSDKVGQITLMLPAAILILVLVYPLFVMVTGSSSFTPLLIICLVLALLKAFYYGPLPSLMANLFPPETRATGMAIGYNVGVALFGGLTPFAVTWLLDTTGSDTAPAYWVGFAALVSIVTLVILRKRGHR